MSVTFIRKPLKPVTPKLQRVVLDITPVQAKIIRALLGGLQSGCEASRSMEPIYAALTKEFGMYGFCASDSGYVVNMHDDTPAD